MLLSGPILLAGAILWRLGTHGADALSGLDRPLRVVLEPLRTAYEGDHDVALLAYLAWQGLLLLLLWARSGGALYRLAAVDLTTGVRASAASAHAFARRHWRAGVGARLALGLSAALPLALAIGLAALGRLHGWAGGLPLALGVVAATLLATAAVLVLAGWVSAGFLPGPIIACEDSGAFDALSRTIGYAAASLPRLVSVRLLFLGGVVLGALWSLVRTAGVAALALACLRLGAGREPLERAFAVLDALGTPPDATRLGITGGDYAVALVLAATLFVLVARWAADLVVRVACGRTAAYLVLRERIERVGTDRLRTAPPPSSFQTAAEAGFRDVACLEDA